MTPDIVNAVFEFIGAAFTLACVRRVHTDRGYAGVSVPAITFFMSWGLWNLFYYPHLGQWWSFAGGIALVTANLLWIGMMLHYGRKP